jgi:NAD(P)-dependent dehydrogenase (short-subunit alcohol dehydrogenase family)
VTVDRPFLKKNVVVTGGSSGNGRAIALAFARQGATVVVADLTAEPREGGVPTHRAIVEEVGTEAHFVPCDVTDPDAVERAVASLDDEGGVDVMIANAGILEKSGWSTLTPQAFARTMNVNVAGVLYAAQSAARRMTSKGRGVIVTMASIAGLRATGGYAAYNASKGAVRMLSAALADELGPAGVRVVSVCPGIIDTQMNVHDDPVIGTTNGEALLSSVPLGRWGTADEVAEVVTFLASDRARYVTGASVVVDGGYLRI